MFEDIIVERKIGMRGMARLVGRHENSVSRLVHGHAVWRVNDLHDFASALGLRLRLELEPYTPTELPSHAEAEEAKWAEQARERDERA